VAGGSPKSHAKDGISNVLEEIPMPPGVVIEGKSTLTCQGIGVASVIAVNWSVIQQKIPNGNLSHGLEMPGKVTGEPVPVSGVVGITGGLGSFGGSGAVGGLTGT
jgi:hypothetical protein